MSKDLLHSSLKDWSPSSDDVSGPDNETQARITAFKEKIVLANGEPILLNRRSHRDEPLVITARQVPSPGIALKPVYDSSTSSELLVDMYANDGNKLHPVGFMSWSFHHGFAEHKHYWHFVVEPNNPHEAAAEEQWNQRYLATEVLEEYQGYGIGSLLLASSILIMQRRGETQLRLGLVLDPAKPLWAKFGVNKGSAEIPLLPLFFHPQVNNSIEKFV